MAERRSGSRYLLLVLIALSLAVLSAALLRAQAQSPQDTAAEEHGAACVTICPLPGAHPALPTEPAQPVSALVDAGGFASLHPRTDLPPPALPADHYLPVTLHDAERSPFDQESPGRDSMLTRDP